MVLQVAMSDRGWILVDHPHTTTTTTTASASSASFNALWIFGCILPSLLVGVSSGMLLQEWIRSSQHPCDSKKASSSCLRIVTQQLVTWSQPVQLLWKNQRGVITTVVSQWWWLLLLTCKSTTSWTVGPLAAYCALSLWGLRDEHHHNNNNDSSSKKDTKKLWNTATSTTATVASSQASAGEWDENHHAAGSGSKSTSSVPPKRYLELLVHNVAHTDMILSLEAPLLSAMDTAAGSFCMVDHPPPDENTNDDDDHDSKASRNQRRRRQRHHDANQFCLCRPRFSAFAELSSRVAKALPSTPTKDMLIDIDRFERMEDADTGSYHIVTPRKQNTTTTSITNEVIDPPTTKKKNTTNNDNRTATMTDGISAPPLTTPLPTGFRLDTSNPHLMIPQEEWSDLRVRGRDAPRVEHCPLAGLPLNAVFFPLLAILLPKWQQQMAQKYQDTNVVLPQHVKQVLILVTGVGTPRNSTHNVKGNSTHLLGILMEQFVKLLYPHVTVVRIHSETNLFRYDENIHFVEQELMPCIHAYRDAHARGLPYPDEVAETTTMTTSTNTTTNTTIPPPQPPFDPDWYKSFCLTLSFADGSHARTHAIQASLRVSYRPIYFHIWQLKTFWHVGKLVDDDIEVYSFEEMETSPALEPSSAMDPMTKLVWEEMKAFKQEFVDCMRRGGNDIADFWLRKTRQPVLAVLLVQSSSSSSSNDKEGTSRPPKLYRGTNMEVSMPTGSLCAERNVIGSALADNPGLKREDLKIIAVLQVPLEEVFVEKPPSLTAAAAAAAFVMKHSSSFVSCSSINAMDMEEDWVPTDEQSVNTGNFSGGDPSGQQQQPALPPVVSFAGTAALSIPPPLLPEQPSTPVRRIQLYPQQGHRSHHQQQQQQQNNTHVKTKPGNGDMMARKPKRTVVVHSAVDKNPLKPCGACNEWLKKIAGSNPYFKIITFTDKECNGIYVRPVQE